MECPLCIIIWNVYIYLHLLLSTMPCAIMGINVGSASLRRSSSHDALRHHGFGNFHEAGDVGAFDVVYVTV